MLVCEQEMKKRDQRRDENFFFSSLWARINGGEKRERDTHLPSQARKIKIIRYAFSVFTLLASLQNFVSILKRQNAFYRRAKERKKTDTRALFKRDAH